MLTKQEILLARGARVESWRVGSPGDLLCHMAHSLGFYGDGISLSELSLIITMTGSFLVACASLSQNGFQQEGFREVGRTYELASPPSF